jgi:hypothetical protein
MDWASGVIHPGGDDGAAEMTWKSGMPHRDICAADGAGRGFRRSADSGNAGKRANHCGPTDHRPMQGGWERGLIRASQPWFAAPVGRPAALGLGGLKETRRSRLSWGRVQPTHGLRSPRAAGGRPGAPPLAVRRRVTAKAKQAPTCLPGLPTTKTQATPSCVTPGTSTARRA